VTPIVVVLLTMTLLLAKVPAAQKWQRATDK